jgi:(4S)-4-hydroxy-5-phosphonooxypentane-2,3-dione isomerase
MYHIASYFDVPADRREDFVAAAIEDGRDSVANEPGTLRFELIQDEKTPTRFYLDEAYADREAFEVHATGPHYAKFFSLIEGYLQSKCELIKGMTIAAPSASSDGQQ